MTAQVRYGYLPGAGNHTSFTVSDHDRRGRRHRPDSADAKVSAQDSSIPM
ncbi:MAG: hypothetical protein R3A10_08515 [Caldilineaceae bacterium]